MKYICIGLCGLNKFRFKMKEIIVVKNFKDGIDFQQKLRAFSANSHDNYCYHNQAALHY